MPEREYDDQYIDTTDNTVETTVRLKRGKNRGLVCSQCGREAHPDERSETTGHMSYHRQQWFCDVFCYNIMNYREKQSPYDDPNMHSQYTPVFQKYFDSLKPKESDLKPMLPPFK